MGTERDTGTRDTLGRSLALGLGLVVLLALGGWFVFERFVATSRPAAVVVVAPPPEVRPAPVVVPEVRATVVEVVGAVERAHGEKWVELHVGDALAPDDAVRTGPGARADLRVGDETSRLSIPERSEMRVDEVTRDVHAFQLARGRIDVDYGAREDRVLRVRSENGTVAETRAARFTMLHNDNGAMVAVATQEGSVSLSSGGGTVQVGAGQQSVVFDGAKPLAAEPIPLEVLLKVAAKASKQDALCLSLSGKVRPGSQVFVEDMPAEVSRDGSFHADVPQREGRSKVRVVAREPGGGTREMLVACRPRARAGLSRADSVKFRWGEAP
jgi:FecR protein